jgi:hypothetical protein
MKLQVPLFRNFLEGNIANDVGYYLSIWECQLLVPISIFERLRVKQLTTTKIGLVITIRDGNGKGIDIPGKQRSHTYIGNSQVL